MFIILEADYEPFRRRFRNVRAEQPQDEDRSQFQNFQSAARTEENRVTRSIWVYRDEQLLTDGTGAREHIPPQDPLTPGWGLGPYNRDRRCLRETTGQANSLSVAK
jgi:hypothetical protein